MCCGQKFNTYNGMRRHMGEFHRVEKKRSEPKVVKFIECAFCKEVVVGESGLKTHTVRRHGNWRMDVSIQKKMNMSSEIKDICHENMRTQ